MRLFLLQGEEGGGDTYRLNTEAAAFPTNNPPDLTVARTFRTGELHPGSLTQVYAWTGTIEWDYTREDLSTGNGFVRANRIVGGVSTQVFEQVVTHDSENNFGMDFEDEPMTTEPVIYEVVLSARSRGNQNASGGNARLTVEVNMNGILPMIEVV